MATTVKARNFIARASAIVIIAGMGVGLTTVYGELLDERKAGSARTQLLLQLQRDNDGLRKDNETLRAQVDKQAALLKKILAGQKVTQREVDGAVNVPPPVVIVKPPQNGVDTPPTKPKPGGGTVKPTPKPTPTPTPTPTHLVGCVPVLNLCL